MLSQDGKAHITYYDRERSISYVWDGDDVIEVSYGGYGEPVVARLSASYAMGTATGVKDGLDAFVDFIQSIYNPFNIEIEGWE